MDLIIHVGLHKTGTTTLQDSLHQNYSDLLNKHILYPQTGLFLAQHALIPGTLFSAHHAMDSVSRSTDPKHYLDLLEQEVKQHNPVLTILSSEVFTETTWNREGCLGIIDTISRKFSSTNILLTTREEEQQALSSTCHIIRDNIPGRRENPVDLYFDMLKCFRTWRHFWHESGLPIIEKRLEDSRGDLVDHYIGDIIDQYSPEAREILREYARKQTTQNSRSNADPYYPLLYIVAFILGNSQISPAFFRKATLKDIALECNQFVEPAARNKLVTTKNLQQYLSTFSQRKDAATREPSAHLSLEAKLEALKNAGLASDTITTIIAIANRLVQNYASPD